MSTRNFRRWMTGARGLNVILGLIIVVLLIIIIVGPENIIPGPGSVINRPGDLDKCFPTCAENDGRFLVVAGDGLETIVGQDVNLSFVAESAASELKIYIFDGDNSVQNWDLGDAIYEYKVFADPQGDGQEEGGTPVASVFSTDLANNDWSTITVPVSGAAQGSDGRYYYQFNVSLLDPSATASNAFKVGTNSNAALYTIPGAPFAFKAAHISDADREIIFNGTWDGTWTPAPSYQETNYDGTFTFYFFVPGPVQELFLADGDMDRSDDQLVALDTDDCNTPPNATGGSCPSLGISALYPAFVNNTTQVAPEGIAAGSSGGTGSPNDDNPKYSVNRREPEVTYSVTAPNNQVWTDDNPSGNREWEIFLVSTIQDAPQADVHVNGNSIPDGIYKVTLNGMDMNNTNAWFFAYGICAVDLNGNPTCETGGFQGCTPGYWKQLNQHEWAWDPDNSGDTYLTTDSFEAIFGLSGTTLGAAYTLFDAVDNEGDGDGPTMLARHATAALLNINNPDVNYPYSTSELISQVQNAFAVGEYQSLKDTLDGFNNAGCPLGNNPN